jgi:hypothetical protein
MSLQLSERINFDSLPQPVVPLPAPGRSDAKQSAAPGLGPDTRNTTIRELAEELFGAEPELHSDDEEILPDCTVSEEDISSKSSHALPLVGSSPHVLLPSTFPWLVGRSLSPCTVPWLRAREDRLPWLVDRAHPVNKGKLGAVANRDVEDAGLFLESCAKRRRVLVGSTSSAAASSSDIIPPVAAIDEVSFDREELAYIEGKGRGGRGRGRGVRLHKKTLVHGAQLESRFASAKALSYDRLPMDDMGSGNFEVLPESMNEFLDTVPDNVCTDWQRRLAAAFRRMEELTLVFGSEIRAAGLRI